MKIGAKISFGFLSVLSLTAIVGAIGWGGLGGYASGVEKARQMSELVIDLHRLPLHVAEFERGNDQETLVAAKRLMDEVMMRVERMAEADPTPSLEAATTTLRDYRDALRHYGDLHGESLARRSGMAKTADKIDQNAAQIYDLNYDQYLNGLFILEDLEHQGTARFAFLEGANALMRAVLKARKAEAEFQLGPSPESKDRAAGFMKEIYLANLALRRMAKKAGEEGEATKALSKGVKDYRRRFGEFVEAVDSQSNIAATREVLDAASKNVEVLAEGIAQRQKEAFATISDQAQSARNKVSDAFASATQSMTLRNMLLALHDAEEAFFRTRDPASADEIIAKTEQVSNTLVGLAERTGDETGIVRQTSDLLPSYRSAFDTAKAASLSQAEMLEVMRNLEVMVLDLANQNAVEAAGDMASLYDWGRLMLAVFCVVALIVGVSISLITGRSISRPLKALTASVADLARGNAAAAIPELERADEIGDMARSMGVIRETGANALRAQKTLENTEACLMMVDADGCVAHANPAFKTLASDVANAVGADLPGFSQTCFDGQSFDAFHNEPTLDSERLSQLSASTSSLVNAGGHTFALKLNPVFDEDGAWIGTVVSWRDQTLQIRLEAEVEALIDAAAAGNLEGRLGTDHVEGFMLTLCQGMNRLMDTVEGGVDAAGMMMAALASGDLTQEMAGTYQGIFKRLQADSNRMRAELSSIAISIVGASESLGSAAEEIASGTSDLTKRTQFQSASVEETSTVMADLTETVRSNTASAQEANQIASKTRSAADSGHHVVGQAVEAMEGIQVAATKITDIVSMIDEIAFQTNLLALNAAVEAARAGESGKGFAVVASEVRGLAQRSAEASSEIKVLIENTVGQIGSGVSLVQNVGSGLQEIVSSVNTLADLVSRITEAGQDQTVRLSDASEAVSKMGGMADQNAALAEQTMAAVRSQGQQVDELHRLVRFFKTERDGHTPDSETSADVPDAVLAN